MIEKSQTLFDDITPEFVLFLLFNQASHEETRADADWAEHQLT
jgi:hypothetical protein